MATTGRQAESKGHNPQDKGAHVPRPPAAICLAGGGPAAGLHIGVLKGLRDKGITFDAKHDVWALSCIGAWVGVIYNQAKNDKIEETKKFFFDVFRDDKVFESFPMNTVFTPDWAGNAEAVWDYLLDRDNYRTLFLPKEIMKSFMDTMSALRRMAGSRRRRRRYYNGDFDEIEEFAGFSEGDFNRWTLNQVLAVNPAMRLLMGLVYKSHITGRSRLYYPDSSFLNNIDFHKLTDDDKPFIYHNAWNLRQQELVLFANRARPATTFADDAVKVEGYRSPITAETLCACSALPYIEQTVTIGKDEYCEGALIDTVNFCNLLKDNPDLKEIWVSRLLDANQIKPPTDLYDSMAILCELFAATVGDDDVKLFEYHVMNDPDTKHRTDLTIIEIPVSTQINFDWSHSNLEDGIRDGIKAAHQAVEAYRTAPRNPRGPTIIKAPTTPAERAQRRERRIRMAMERLSGVGRARP
jgi:predicted acylesterase/phospholipase RssA